MLLVMQPVLNLDLMRRSRFDHLRPEVAGQQRDDVASRNLVAEQPGFPPRNAASKPAKSIADRSNIAHALLS